MECHILAINLVCLKHNDHLSEYPEKSCGTRIVALAKIGAASAECRGTTNYTVAKVRN
jgi:hypothetical protein